MSLMKKLEVVSCDAVVVGGGIVGLAVAWKLSEIFDDVILIEKEKYLGTANTTRNSGVIHAGLYYGNSPLKEQFCIRGNFLLNSLIENGSIIGRRCGKFLIAQIDQGEAIEQIYNHSLSLNLDVERSEALDKSLFTYESAIFSKNSSIIEQHSMIDFLERNFLNNGSEIIKNLTVERIVQLEKCVDIILEDQNFYLKSRIVINCAGLSSAKLAQEKSYEYVLYKGNYFKTNNFKFNTLVYPVPERHGLGVHITVDLDNNVKFGPDVQHVNREDFSVNLKRISYFNDEIKKYLKISDELSLTPDYAGIRPKLHKSGEQINDFTFEETHDDFSTIIDCLGIESPGLTASIPIGEYVADLVRERR